MSAQPIWITPPGSLGVVPGGTFYQVPLQVTDTAVADILTIEGNGTSVTVKFFQQSEILFQPGDSVVVAGVNPSVYNGTFTVISCTKTQVVYTSNASGTWVAGGTVSSVPSNVFFKAIAGALPAGIECTATGVIQGVPTNVVTVADEAVVAGVNVTSKFAIRAYTTKTIGGMTVINRLADRTFTLTVAGNNLPSWITPPGELAQLFVGELLVPGIQLDYVNDNPTNIPPAITVYSGSLPPGLTVSSTGLISGYVELNTTISAIPGFSRNGQGFSQYPFDFDINTPNENYDFVLQLTDGRTSVLRAFSLYVYSTSTFLASTTYITADDTYLTASISTVNAPVIINPQGSIGTAPNNTYFAYQFIGKDINFEDIGFTGFNIPPGLYLDPDTGWLTGYLPVSVATETTYNFTVVAYLVPTPSVTSGIYHYSLTVTGIVSGKVTWLTPAFLGDISNGGTSIFYVAATTAAGYNLQYRLESGSNSRLPQGLTLLPSGHIVGRVSFNTFALDGGTTRFDHDTTTFDSDYTFTVNAFTTNNFISSSKTFTIKVLRVYNKPYENLYIQCMPPVNDRALITNFLENINIFTPSLIYRPDDPNFGLSRNVIYYHAYGLNAATLDTYVTALQLNHYWKNLVLGEIKTAQALDPVTGEVVYEVVYSEVIDDLVNNAGVSVGKEVLLAYPVENQTVDVVYPNALVDMRDQVIDVVGQESNVLPLWMLSKQANGNVLGFTPAWVIAYTIPGASGQIQYNIQTLFGTQLNQVDFEADRYELDSALTYNWDAATQSWIPNPPLSCTFDINYHYDVAVAAQGTGYAVGDRIKISGTALGGVTPVNDITIKVNTVGAGGVIIDAFYEGTASILTAGATYDNLAGTNITGTGSGASWDITVVPGVQTVFDGGSVTFNDPADLDTNTNAYDRYLMYPKRTILG
jgi:hypothetical protein